MKLQFFQSSIFVQNRHFVPIHLFSSFWPESVIVNFFFFFSQCRGEAHCVCSISNPKLCALLAFSSTCWRKLWPFLHSTSRANSVDAETRPTFRPALNRHKHSLSHTHKDTFRPVWTGEHWPAVVCVLQLQLLRVLQVWSGLGGWGGGVIRHLI